MPSNLFFLAAFQFRLERFLEPTLILGSGATSAELLRWAAVLDLFGYYLATAVLAYVLWRQLRPRNPLMADLSTTAAVGYPLAGGVGVAVLAMVAPTLMHGYTDATAAGQALIAAQFATVLQVVWRAIWQLLDAILLATWWLGIGWLLRSDGLVPDSSGALGLEAIAHSRLGDEVARPSWIIFELVPERLDVLTQIVALFHIRRAPDLLQQLPLAD
jgi:hypothetical protein